MNANPPASPTGPACERCGRLGTDRCRHCYGPPGATPATPETKPPAPPAAAPNGGPDARRRVVLVSMAATVSLLTLKLCVAASSRSVSVMAECADAMGDLFAVALAWAAVRRGGPGAGAEAREIFSAFGQAAVMGGMALWTGWQAICRLVAPVPPVQHALAAALVMGLSAGISALAARWVGRRAGEAGSLALQGLAADHRSHVWMAGGAAAGLLAVTATGFARLDAAIALCISGLVIRAAGKSFDAAHAAFHALAPWSHGGPGRCGHGHRHAPGLCRSWRHMHERGERCRDIRRFGS